MSRSVLVSAAYDREVRFWDLGCGRTVRKVLFEESQVNCLHLCCNSRYLVVGGSCVIRVFDLESDSSVDAAGYPAIVNVSKYECSGPTNFTSIGSFRLRKESNEGSGIGLEESVVDLYAMTLIGLNTNVDSDVSLVLYATSEDGYIRFFDGRFSGSLRVIKTIRTGAAITCSALSPDNRFLLTGSQIGQVSLWHLPSVVGSIALESRKLNANTNSNSASNHNGSSQQGTNIASPLTTEGSASMSGKMDSASATVAREAVMLFGSRPLQTISFENDYSAVRSVALSPVGWWGVAATHCGNVHFLCLSMFGSAASSAVDGNGNVHSDDQNLQVEKNAEDSTSLNNASTGEAFLAGALGRGKAGKGEEGGAQQRARYSTYASALEANNQRANGLYGGLSQDAESGAHSSTVSPGTNTNTNRMELGGKSSVDPELKILRPRKDSSQSLNQSIRRNPLQRELEMEVFHTFKAHNKYILKVALSPNNTLLVTCSADYSVGRFQIPDVLQEWRMNPNWGKQRGGMSEQVSMHSGGLAEGGANQNVFGGGGGTFFNPKENSLESSVGSVQNNETAQFEDGEDKLGKGLPTPVTATATPTAATSHADPLAGSSTLGDKPMTTSLNTANQTSPAIIQSNKSGAPMAESFERKSTDITPETPAPPTPSGVLNSIHFIPLKSLTGHARWVWDCAFSSCSSFLFTAGSDAHIRMWNGLKDSDNSTSTAFTGHTKPVVTLLLFNEKRRAPVK